MELHSGRSLSNAKRLLRKPLHSFLDQNALIRVVGDAPSVRVEDMQRTRPDLIVFGLDNATHDVAEALGLARSVLPNVRFCVLSSYANPDIMQRSIASGADGFVVKDVTPSELDVAFRVLASGSSYVDPRLPALCSNGVRRAATPAPRLAS